MPTSCSRRIASLLTRRPAGYGRSNQAATNGRAGWLDRKAEARATGPDALVREAQPSFLAGRPGASGSDFPNRTKENHDD
jgi:hypothetical protein